MRLMVATGLDLTRFQRHRTPCAPKATAHDVLTQETVCPRPGHTEGIVSTPNPRQRGHKVVVWPRLRGITSITPASFARAPFRGLQPFTKGL